MAHTTTDNKRRSTAQTTRNRLSLRKSPGDQPAADGPSEQYRVLFETMTQGVMYLDASGAIVDVNPAALRILGRARKDVVGLSSSQQAWRPLRESGEDFPADEHPCNLALATGRRVDRIVMGVYNPRLDNHVWIQITAVPQYRDGETKPFQVYTIFDDITERKEARRALEESERRYRQLVENAVEGILVLEADKIAFANRRIEELTGFALDRIVGRSPEAFVHPGDLAEVNRVVEGHRSGRTVSSLTSFRILGPDGEVSWIESNAISIEWDGEPAILCFMTDATESRRSEVELRLANERLRREQEALANKNTALTQVLNHLDDEKRAMAAQIQANVDRVIGPMLRRLMQSADGQPGRDQIDLLETSLSEITAPFLSRLESLYSRLTQREVEVASMIRNGLSSKEIAAGLGVSIFTVHNLRARMRRKLNLSGCGRGLGEFLRSL